MGTGVEGPTFPASPGEETRKPLEDLASKPFMPRQLKGSRTLQAKPGVYLFCHSQASINYLMATERLACPSSLVQAQGTPRPSI